MLITRFLRDWKTRWWSLKDQACWTHFPSKVKWDDARTVGGQHADRLLPPPGCIRTIHLPWTTPSHPLHWRVRSRHSMLRMISSHLPPRGFFWLLGALLSSALWFGFQFTEIWTLVIVESVLFEEAFRGLLWYIFMLTSRRQKLDSKMRRTPIAEEIALGSGIAMGRALIMCGSILWESRGPGSFYLPSCQLLPLFLTAALTTHMTSIMDVMWTITAFEGFYTRSWPKLAFVITTHLMSASLNLLNSWEGSWLCWIALLGQFALMVLSCGVGYLSFRSQLSRSVNYNTQTNRNVNDSE